MVKRTGLAFISLLLVTAGVLAWKYRWRSLEPVPGIELAGLPVPILSYAAYQQLDHHEPYIVRLGSGQGELLYYGARHTQNPENPQVLELQRVWHEFDPTIALAESRLGFFVGPLSAGVKQFGEAGAVFALARREGVPVYTLEPPLALEMREVLKRWPAERVALFYVLRGAVGEGSAEAVEKEAAQLARKRTRWPGLEGALRDVDHIDAIWRRDFPGLPDWRELPARYTWPGHRDTYLNEIATDVNRFRDRYMVSLLTTLVQRGERVLAVVGSSHVVMQEPALRALLGPGAGSGTPRR